MSDVIERLEPGAIIAIPPEVALCPYCGGKLLAQPTAWTERDDGTWTCTESGIECIEEPDIDGDAWEDFHAQHSEMPYVYWLPVDEKCQAWINSKYRWNL